MLCETTAFKETYLTGNQGKILYLYISLKTIERIFTNDSSIRYTQHVFYKSSIKKRLKVQKLDLVLVHSTVQLKMKKFSN